MVDSGESDKMIKISGKVNKSNMLTYQHDNELFLLHKYYSQ